MTHLDVFTDLDRFDLEGWLRHLAPDVVIRFAGERPVYGHDGARATMGTFLESITSISHEIIERWEHGNATIVEASVTVGLAGGDTAVLAMATVFRTNAEGLIGDYRVYVDPRPLQS